MSDLRQRQGICQTEDNHVPFGPMDHGRHRQGAKGYLPE